MAGSIRDVGMLYPTANIVANAIFFAGVHVLARRQPDPLGFLVLLFPILIINMPMSAVTQGAAIGLICIAFVSFIDRRPIWFAFWVLVAAGFHSSALVFFLLLPIATGRYTKTRLLMVAVFAIPGSILLASGDSAQVAAARYIGNDRDAFGAVFRTGVLVLTAMYFFLFVKKKWQRSFPKDYSLVAFGAIGMVIAFLVLPVSSIIADRFGYYLIPVQTIIFARLPFLSFRSHQALHRSLPYIGLLVVFLVWTQLSWHFQQCYVPYNSWIFGMPSDSMLRFR